MSNGKKFSVKRGAGVKESDVYPVEVCSVRYKSAGSGQWAKTPESVKKAKKGTATGQPAQRAKARKGKAGGLVVVRSVVDGETLSARAVLGDARRDQRRGKVTKATVREAEQQVSRDALAFHNPRLAAAVDSEQMHEAHRSDKARRGATTRKKNAAAGRTKKRRSPTQVQADMLMIEQRLKDAQRRHAGAKSISTKSKHADTVKRHRSRLASLRAELRQVQK